MMSAPSTVEHLSVASVTSALTLVTDIVPVVGKPAILLTESAIDTAKVATLVVIAFATISMLDAPLIVASTFTEPALNETFTLLAATPASAAMLATTLSLISNFCRAVTAAKSTP
jgi:hypothetical protein